MIILTCFTSINTAGDKIKVGSMCICTIRGQRKPKNCRHVSAAYFYQSVTDQVENRLFIDHIYKHLHSGQQLPGVHFLQETEIGHKTLQAKFIFYLHSKWF